MSADRMGCRACKEDKTSFDFVMAFQPIVDLERRSVFGYEALVRGARGESAASVLAGVTDTNRYHFDQAARVKAIETAGRLFQSPDLKLSINFLPNAVYEPAACIKLSLAAADRCGLARHQIMFEFTENERMTDTAKVTRIVEEYKRCGFVTAIDDFGAGFAGLGLLAAFAPDIVKIDMDLIRDIHQSPRRQAIVAGIAFIARELDIDLIAEGVECEAEVLSLRAAGIRLFQGYHFARPVIERLPEVDGIDPQAKMAAAERQPPGSVCNSKRQGAS